MLLDIRRFPDPVLRQKARPVGDFDDRLRALVRDMFETMYHNQGVGLAAPQVGESLRLCVIDPQAGDEAAPPAPLAIINPEFVERDGEVRCEEGCLSLPGQYAEVLRSERVVLSYRDEQGQQLQAEFDGFAAIVVQHEIDHLDGKVFIDRIGGAERDLIKRRIRKAIKEGNW